MSAIFRAVLLKDLKLMLLPGLAWLAFNFVFVVLEFFSAIVGSKDLAHSLESQDYYGFGIGAAIIAAIFAPGMMFKEADTRTLRFLDQLPVSRLTLFVSRYISLLIWILVGQGGYLILEGMIVAFFSLGTPQISIWVVYGSLFVANVYFIILFLPIITVLSLLRGAYAWIVTSVIYYFILIYSLEHMISTTANFEYRLWNLLAVPDLEFVDDTVVWSTQPALGLLIIGSIALSISAWSYRHIGKPASFVGISKTWKHSWVKVVVVLASAAVLTVIAVTQIAKDRGMLQEAFEILEENDETELTVRETTHFIWMVQQRDLEDFGEIIRKGDNIYEALLQTFGKQDFDPGQRITVVPTDKIQDYAAGTAHWKRMKLARELEHAEQIEEVFRHELVHVLIELWSKGSLRAHFDHTGAFHEGTAQYFQQCAPDHLDLILSQAALNHSWNHFTFDEIFDHGAIKDNRGIQFLYSYGWLYVSSLIERHGNGIIPEIAEAFSEYRGSDLKGAMLWQAVLKDCGISIEELRSDFTVRLNSLGDEHASLLKSLPKPEAKLIQKEDRYFLEPTVVSELESASMVANLDTTGSYLEAAELNEDGLIPVPGQRVQTNRVEVQLGWKVSAAEEKKHAAYWSNVKTIRLLDERH